jgi:low molecular weight phosphotyrosine protein phosphatase
LYNHKFMETSSILNILFVCLGNICRSPMAEMIFNKIIKEKGFHFEFTSLNLYLGITDRFRVDSAGTASYHIGERPDSRSIEECKKHFPGLFCTHKARQITLKDFFEFDYIFVMDENNYKDVMDIKPKDSKVKVQLLGKWDPQASPDDKKTWLIKDPYYGR